MEFCSPVQLDKIHKKVDISRGHKKDKLSISIYNADDWVRGGGYEASDPLCF